MFVLYIFMVLWASPHHGRAHIVVCECVLDGTVNPASIYIMITIRTMVVEIAHHVCEFGGSDNARVLFNVNSEALAIRKDRVAE